MVTETEIQPLIENGLSVEQISIYTGAGMSCGTCKEFISEMIMKNKEATKQQLLDEKYIRVMFDYCASAVWDKEGFNRDYSDFPISVELSNAFNAWTIKMDKKMWKWDSSGESELKGVTKPDIIALCDEGRALASKLKQELPDWTIIYFDDSKMTNDDNQPRSTFEYEITLEDV